VTLVLAVHGRESIWLVADRRLSYGGRRPPIDDAMKVVDLETIDGKGLIAYAGLGATGRGTQPSQWICAILRGRGGLSFEQALQFVADAATRELPKHLSAMPVALHNIIIPAHLRNGGRKMYSIDNRINCLGVHEYRFTSHRLGSPDGPSVPIGVAGTGGLYLASRGGAFARELLNLVRANDRGSLSDIGLADYLAGLNWTAHRGVRDGTVGPRCVVVWRRIRQTRLPGGGHQFYTGVDRESGGGSIPAIANGMDVRSLVSVLWDTHVPEMRRALLAREEPRLDQDEVNRRLAALPSDPDDKLR
jgi:hypothetical protein